MTTRSSPPSLALSATLLLLTTGAPSQDVYDKGTNPTATHATLEGVVAIEATPRYGAFSLRSPAATENDRLQVITPVTELDQNTPYSIMAWIKVNAGGGQAIIGFGGCCSPREGYTLNFMTDSRIRFWGGCTSDDTNYNCYSASPLPNDNNWHHVGARVNASQIEVLIDGAVSITCNLSNLPTSPSLSNPNQTHARWNPQVGGDGVSVANTADLNIDEVRIYSQWLDNVQWADAMNNIGPLPDQLYYDFEPPAELRVRTVDAVPSEVYWGETGIPVSVTVENTGTIDIHTMTVDLHFTDSGMVDRDSEYTVIPDPMNPTTIAIGATETFNLTVDVSAAPTVDLITIDASASGLDALAGTTVTDPDADTPDTWNVRVCPSTLCGDCNNDGAIDILDALEGARHAALVIFLAGRDFSNCNVAGAVEPDPGAVVDVIDALYIAQIAAQLPVSLTCC